MPKVAITNGYSAKNAGDGLLVRLTIDMLQECGLSVESITLIAADPVSFRAIHPHLNVAPAPAAIGDSFLRRAISSARALTGRPFGHAGIAISQSSLVVAVGGGYLRFGTPVEAFKARVVHVSQIAWAAGLGKQVILMPQSIGPLAFAGRRPVSTLLRAERIFVRDDRSISDLQKCPNVTRMPDLGVLEIARTLKENAAKSSAGPVVMVLRRLARQRSYTQNTRELARRTQAIVALQSTAGSGNDDRTFIAELGLDVGKSAMQELSELLANNVPSVVVSVRLHGAIQSILAGIPAVHLSYERKGFAAFEDLGLEEWVHNARSFDPAVVAKQVMELKSDSRKYFLQVERQQRAILACRAELIDAIGDALARVVATEQ